MFVVNISTSTDSGDYSTADAEASLAGGTVYCVFGKSGDTGAVSIAYLVR